MASFFQFAAINDDILFGEVSAKKEQLSAHDRSMITIPALISGGNFEQSPAILN